MSTIDLQQLRVTLWSPGRRKAQTASSLARGLEAALNGGIRTVVIREPELDSVRISAALELVSVSLLTHNARMLMHADSGGGVTERDGALRPWVADLAKMRRLHGIHLPADASDRRQVEAAWSAETNKPCALSTSCHNAEELARTDGYDFVFLSPVLPTQSHPGRLSLGQDVAHDLTAAAHVPVVWLGGIHADNPADWSPCNAAGIGVLGAFWESPTIQRAEQLVDAAKACTG